MSYDLVKNGIALLLQGLALQESDEAVDFKNAPVNTYGNTFILKCLKGEMNEKTIIDHFNDKQEWQVQVAFTRSTQDDLIQRDQVHRKKDAILPVLDKPDNWTGFAKFMKYRNWEITEFPNYYVLSIRLEVIDTYTYS